MHAYYFLKICTKYQVRSTMYKTTCQIPKFPQACSKHVFYLIDLLEENLKTCFLTSRLGRYAEFKS